MAVVFPERMKRAVSEQFGASGQDWLGQHQLAVGQLAASWGITLGQPLDGGLATNVVFACERNGESLVLKTGYPHPEIFTELAVLKAWRGRSCCVQLIESDRATGCKLMQRIYPGDTFRQAPVTIRSRLVPDLHRSVPMAIDPALNLPAYEHWFQVAAEAYLEGSGKAWFVSHLERAGNQLKILCPAGADQLLLHGDLHHENMLLCEDGDYIAVDPKGVTGPRVLEYGRFLHNFLTDEPAPMAAVIEQRITALSGEVAGEQILKAGYVDLVLSSAWSLNAGESLPDHAPALLDLLAGMSA